MGGFEARSGRRLQEAAQRLAFLDPDDGIVIAGHAAIGLKGRAAGHDALVGSGRMRVGADDEAHAPVQEMPHGLFLAGRFRMHIDHDRVATGGERASLDFAFGGPERVVGKPHENPPDEVEDEHPGACLRLDDRRSASGRAGGPIRGADQAGLTPDEDERLALIPGMVAERHRIGTRFEELGTDHFGNSGASCRVFAVHDHAIERKPLSQPGKPLEDRVPARPSHHIADEQKAHRSSSRPFRGIKREP